jgi:pyruvate kinase
MYMERRKEFIFFLKTIDNIREVRKATNLPVALLYDTKGPEFRTLKFENGGISLKMGDTIKMSKTCNKGSELEFGVNHSDAIDFIEVGDKVLIDNALLELEVIRKENDYVLLKALGDGKIQDHKSINVPGVNLKLDFMSDVDKDDITFAVQHACDYLALSFVTKKEDVLEAREIVKEAGGDVLIISKIESQLGIKNIDEIIDVSDGIMVARGDLGVEVPLEELPMLQKKLLENVVKRASLPLSLLKCWLPCMRVLDLQGQRSQTLPMQYWTVQIV